MKKMINSNKNVKQKRNILARLISTILCLIILGQYSTSLGVTINYTSGDISFVDVTVELVNGSDALSGGQTSTYSASGATTFGATTTTKTITTNGTTTLLVTTRDSAGNTATRSYTVKLSKPITTEEIANAISGTSATPETAKQYIGKQVTYNGDSNWEIFYAGNKFSSDGSTHVYLISKTNRGDTTQETGESSGTTANVISDADKLCSWYKTYKTSINSNAKATYYMLTASNYSTYLDSTVADWAIGGPTEDIFIESYNKYYGKTYTYETNNTDYNSTGYICERKGTGNQANTSLFDANIPNDGAPYNRGYDYWLASPSSYGGGYNVRRLNYGGAYLFESLYIDTTGLRPLVSLKSGVTLTPVGDGTYTVQ